jgi:hypothetical protein
MTLATGRISVLTFPTRLRVGGALWARVLFGIARRVPRVTAPLFPLRKIHVARWVLVTKVGGRRVGAHLVFLGDFDGDLLRYIDTFAETVTWRMRSVWAMSSGYPGLVPTEGFEAFVRAREADDGHAYARYPEAATSTIVTSLAALEVWDRRRAALLAETDDARFLASCHALFAEVQPCL